MNEQGGVVPFDCIGFDLDGTLLHTGRELAASVNHVLGKEGVEPLPAENVMAMIGGGARVLLGRAFAARGEERAAESIDAMLPVFLNHYTANLGNDTIIHPGLETLLDILAEQGVKLAVVTNKNEDLARLLLQKMGLAERFEIIIGGDTLGPTSKKPKPDMLHFMLRSINSKKPLFIGDSEADTKAAEAASIPCIAVTFGYSIKDVRMLGAAHVIDHYDELLPLLENWD